jgi:hypothetical protein
MSVVDEFQDPWSVIDIAPIYTRYFPVSYQADKNLHLYPLICDGGKLKHGSIRL